MGVGLRLKIALREHKMTIKELAEKSGVSLHTLYSITKRDSQSIDMAILEDISTTLGLAWSFFLSAAPFEDLEFLKSNKLQILEILKEQGITSTVDVENYEFWQIISQSVHDIFKDELGQIIVQSDNMERYDPRSDVACDVDTLLNHFIKLEPGGRKLVIEYAELLASNPGFLQK